MDLIAAPDTDLAQGAAALAAEVEPPFLVLHSVRTYRLGAHLLTSIDCAYDAEILYVASMLHDIALGTELDDGVTPFHLKGAGVAANYMIGAARSATNRVACVRRRRPAHGIGHC